MPTKTKNIGGRPPIYTAKLGKKICDKIAAGATLRSLENMPGMPSKRSMLRWLAVHPDFRAMYAAAHQYQAEDDFDKLRSILNGPAPMDKQAIEREKMRISTIKWIIGLKNPDTFGSPQQTAFAKSCQNTDKALVGVTDAAK